MDKSTIICSTYNNLKFLTIVLESLKYQTDQNFELIIADDGSRSDTSEYIKTYSEEVKFPVKHIWHEDNGWRKAKIHNKAIMSASNDHIIFIDGDCILGHNFVRDHRQIYLREKDNFVLMGRRIELGQKISKGLDKNNYRVKLRLLNFDYLKDTFFGETHGGLRCLSLSSAFSRWFFKADKVHDLLGANFERPRKN